MTLRDDEKGLYWLSSCESYGATVDPELDFCFLHTHRDQQLFDTKNKRYLPGRESASCVLMARFSSASGESFKNKGQKTDPRVLIYGKGSSTTPKDCDSVEVKVGTLIGLVLVICR